MLGCGTHLERLCYEAVKSGLYWEIQPFTYIFGGIVIEIAVKFWHIFSCHNWAGNYLFFFWGNLTIAMYHGNSGRLLQINKRKLCCVEMRDPLCSDKTD